MFLRTSNSENAVQKTANAEAMSIPLNTEAHVTKNNVNGRSEPKRSFKRRFGHVLSMRAHVKSIDLAPRL